MSDEKFTIRDGAVMAAQSQFRIAANGLIAVKLPPEAIIEGLASAMLRLAQDYGLQDHTRSFASGVEAALRHNKEVELNLSVTKGSA